MPWKDKSKHRAACRDHYRRNKEQYRERNKRAIIRMREWVNEQKAKPCADCGIQYPPEAMDFDHVRGEKVAEISALIVRNSKRLLKEEIAKCDVVCSNCHRVRTRQRLAA